MHVAVAKGVRVLHVQNALCSTPLVAVPPPLSGWSKGGLREGREQSVEFPWRWLAALVERCIILPFPLDSKKPIVAENLQRLC